MTEINDRFSKCSTCIHFGGMDTVKNYGEITTLHCKQKGQKSGCLLCRVNLSTATKENSCPLNLWGDLPEPEKLEVPKINYVPASTSPSCVHLIIVGNKNWGNCGIEYKNRPHTNTCLQCDRREPKKDT